MPSCNAKPPIAVRSVDVTLRLTVLGAVRNATGGSNGNLGDHGAHNRMR